MTTEEILVWLKTLPIGASAYYAGTMDGRKEKTVSVYRDSTGAPRNIAVGGEGCTKNASCRVSVLLHWSASGKESETAADLLYRQLVQARNVAVGAHAVTYLELPYDAPMNVGIDENGIREYVIDLVIHYGREV